MLHAPAAPVGKDPAASYKSRLGIWMFLCYLAVYVVFVAINVGNPLLMELYADATGCSVIEPATQDATLLGVAMVVQML